MATINDAMAPAVMVHSSSGSVQFASSTGLRRWIIGGELAQEKPSLPASRATSGIQISDIVIGP
ncbi:hypothetical protein [Mycobacterium intracellulare]|uniref:hypothetical protein n=1 Tax=Mycobacterium intracellulare TaxID=1767 RepID=UPI0011D27D8D|nr:hypothetical protein [Mycobacterium intracellulare]UQB88495.1 hypothetical protein KN249_06640 [Mycobacterium intracellulare]UQC06313.1 hypothetical protein KN251_19440 [Mycobacterium intracellulare ATCC 13950]